VRGKPKRVDADLRQFIEVRERLVRLMGDVPRLEMFAREAAPGWDSLGARNGIHHRPAQGQARGAAGDVHRGVLGEDMTQPIPINTIEVVPIGDRSGDG